MGVSRLSRRRRCGFIGLILAVAHAAHAEALVQAFIHPVECIGDIDDSEG